MTGFARATAGDLSITLKAVNGKGLDLHFHLPGEFDAFEAPLRALLKEQIHRGTVQIRMVYNPPAPEMVLNKSLLHAWLRTFQEAARELGLAAQPDLNAAFRLAGIFHSQAASGAVAEAEVLDIAREALVEFNRFREREGAALREELLVRAAGVVEVVARIEEIRAGATKAFQDRLRERLGALLGAALEPERLIQEAAILADRSDVSEELVRLRTHAGQLEALLQGGGEIGKRIDFLLQEMNRETNTVLSKTGGLGETGLVVTDLALRAKSEIDKIREQSLNLE